MQKHLLGLLLLIAMLISASVAIAQPELPPVVPVGNPPTLQNDFVNWDWDAFLGDRNIQPPDPLTIVLPETYQGTWPAGPFDLSDVRFVDSASLNPVQRELLAQNGFVIVPGGESQFEAPYYFDPAWNVDTGHGYWVTTDALLHSLHVAFVNLLSFLEAEELHTRVSDVALRGYEAAFAQYKASLGTTLEDPARAAVLYYAVALGLLLPDSYASTVDAGLQPAVTPLIEAAVQAEGRLDVPFLTRYQEDFSQYRPRGTYTTTELLQRYFRGMMWLGRITFLTRDDSSLLASLLVLRALEQSGAAEQWASVSETLAFLIGPTDNLGPAEHLPLAQAIYGTNLPLDALADISRLTEFRAQVQALPGPRINNVVRPIGTQVDELDENTCGFRLFGQRFTFDGYAMQRLIYPYVGEVNNERLLPAGLDVAAALGSDLAYALLEAQGETVYTNYVPNMIGLREEVNLISGTDWLENIYGGWLMALQPLWNRNEESYPPLMHTEAWRLRDLQTGLASWAELKHATVLYAAQPMGGLGGGGPDPVPDTTSYIEPNPLVFSRIAVVAASMVQGLADRDIGIRDYTSNQPPGGLVMVRSAFEQLAVLAARLADMANRHLWGSPLTDEEQIFLKYDFGSQLSYIRYVAEMALIEPPTMAAIVTDVASNPDAGTVLQVGTGYVDYIYVITDSPQGLQLTRGAVYSYYEFVHPIDDRLTNETWRDMVQAGTLPPRPIWVSNFFAE